MENPLDNNPNSTRFNPEDPSQVSVDSIRTETFIFDGDSIASCGDTTVQADGHTRRIAIDSLANLHVKEIEAFAATNELCFVKRNYEAGEYLLHQGDLAEGLFIIDSGTVQVVDKVSGHLIDQQSAPGVFGEISILTGQPCSADVIAETDVTARLLSAQSYASCETAGLNVEQVLGGLASTRLGHHVHDALHGKTLHGYRIDRCISRGGMGVVYEAEDPDGRQVAVKMLMHRFIADESMQRRFADEAAMLERLDHPNINRFLDHFQEYRTHFLVLQLCDGTDLGKYVQQKGCLPNAEIKSIIKQVAAGLLEAHEKGVLHRDLKPANLLISRRGEVQIADFGLSRLRELQSVENTIVGTPTYMAPELFRRIDSGMRGDFYALGCLMYQLVTGRHLFRWQVLGELIKTKNDFCPETAITSESIAELRDGNPVDPEILNWIVTALQADPQKREIDLARIASRD
ncbi:Serine/threonine-protein kinase PknA [Rubripirellula obstinata]|uniref:Serine/threonine-protein kinase PknA n=1 Tax=Rubripirellula obstinata TaxID=406547 RepID=A0A5B1CL04_9BACT|nr:protein kinase [Rubripirellula obstinata]KAA1261748.1 Serine/threonine-protein kinase PknA [Rubripirellula obstinata]